MYARRKTLAGLGEGPQSQIVIPSNAPTPAGYSCVSAGNASYLPQTQICYLLPQAQSAPTYKPPDVTVTVAPQIQTQVSPQVSPVFQQQFQPSNSPATAGTTQMTAPPAQPAPVSYAPPAPPAGPIGVNSSSMQPSAPAQLPPAPAPSYAAQPAPVSYAPAQPEQLPPSPLPASTPAPAAPQVTMATAAPAFDWKIAAIIGAGLFGALAFSKRK